MFALPMTPDQLDVYRRCTARTKSPIEPAKEAWLICGRRAGKSFILALCAVFIACFRDWGPHLAPGERATIMVIASDRRQARTIIHYIGGLLTKVPMLAELIERETVDELRPEQQRHDRGTDGLLSLNTRLHDRGGAV